MKLIDRQYAFVERQLHDSAKAVGIDLSVSKDALIALAYFSDDIESDLRELCGSESVYAEASRLTSAFNSKAGSWLLKGMGDACSMIGRDTYFPRLWEVDCVGDEWSGKGAKMAACKNALAHRVLCDFAMYTGIAANRCAEYLQPNKPASLGGRARAASFDMRRAKVITICESEFPNWRSESAEKIAGEIFGRPGVDLSHRVIAETIRAAKK